MSVLTQKEKEYCISRFLETKVGRSKLAESMIRPLMEQSNFCSVVALIFKAITGDIWKNDNYYLTKSKIQQVSAKRIPRLFSFVMKPQFTARTLVENFEHALSYVSRELYTNENEILWRLLQKAIDNKLIKCITRKILTLKFLESLSLKYDYLVCNAMVYSTFRKQIAQSPNLSTFTSKQILKTSGLGKLNNMQLIVTRTVPDNTIYFFKKKCGEFVRDIDNICIKTKGKKAKDKYVETTFEQQINMTINPKMIFAVKLEKKV